MKYKRKTNNALPLHPTQHKGFGRWDQPFTLD